MFKSPWPPVKECEADFLAGVQAGKWNSLPEFSRAKGYPIMTVRGWAKRGNWMVMGRHVAAQADRNAVVDVSKDTRAMSYAVVVDCITQRKKLIGLVEKRVTELVKASRAKKGSGALDVGEVKDLMNILRTAETDAREASEKLLGTGPKGVTEVTIVLPRKPSPYGPDAGTSDHGLDGADHGLASVNESSVGGAGGAQDGASPDLAHHQHPQVEVPSGAGVVHLPVQEPGEVRGVEMAESNA